MARPELVALSLKAQAPPHGLCANHASPSPPHAVWVTTTFPVKWVLFGKSKPKISLGHTTDTHNIVPTWFPQSVYGCFFQIAQDQEGSAVLLCFSSVSRLLVVAASKDTGGEGPSGQLVLGEEGKQAVLG